MSEAKRALERIETAWDEYLLCSSDGEEEKREMEFALDQMARAIDAAPETLADENAIIEECARQVELSIGVLEATNRVRALKTDNAAPEDAKPLGAEVNLPAVAAPSTATVALLPCPFCGSPAKESFDARNNEHWVLCSNDSCNIAPVASARILNDVRKMWNSRQSAGVPTTEQEHLRALAQAIVDRFHAEYPEGTNPAAATRVAMGYLSLLAPTLAK